MNTLTKSVSKFDAPAEFTQLLEEAPSVTVAKNVDDLVNLAAGGKDSLVHEVFYDLPNGERKKEAIVHRVKNGIAAKYTCGGEILIVWLLQMNFLLISPPLKVGLIMNLIRSERKLSNG